MKTPAISTAVASPPTPIWSTQTATSTMKAPAGPPIWNRDPPSADTSAPPTMAV